jgi:hypothetical protein
MLYFNFYLLFFFHLNCLFCLSVDKALAENASGRAKLWPSFFASLKQIFVSPVKYVQSPQFRWIWLVYGATYCAGNTSSDFSRIRYFFFPANATDTVCSATSTDAKIPKLLSTFVVNTTTCIGKVCVPLNCW